MIINSGSRTDIPAYFNEWFYNRIAEGYVLVRNPYYPEQVQRYQLSPDVVDILCFCTKNPQPMLARLGEISHFRQFWFVTITPYGTDIEPYVPHKDTVMESFKRLSDEVGPNCVDWRYDPILINETYTVDYHIAEFERMASVLEGYTKHCVISFIDLYQKTRRNFPEVRSVNVGERARIGKAFVEIGKRHGLTIRTCAEGNDLAPYGVDTRGCMTQNVLEDAIGAKLIVPKQLKPPRESCECLLGNDIGTYNTCGHGCRYCYANYDWQTVVQNMRLHDPKSPLLIGHLEEGDVVKEAKQKSYFDGQMEFLF